LRLGAVHVVGALALLGFVGCKEIGGSYTLLPEDEDAGSEPPACDDDEDCDALLNEGCDRGRCAIRCINDAQCPAFAECWAAKYCTEPIGTPCSTSDVDACGGYACRAVDAEVKPVPGYCPGHCSASTPCPDDFVCITLSCYRVAENVGSAGATGSRRR
jgi:hypothetical protein